MELQKLLQDEIREGLYRITISGPRGDSEVSKVRIRPVEIKGKLLFQCQETVGTKEFHKNMTKDDVITRISDWMNGTFKQLQQSTAGYSLPRSLPQTTHPSQSGRAALQVPQYSAPFSAESPALECEAPTREVL